MSVTAPGCTARKECLFVADLHLCPEQPALIAGFRRFIAQRAHGCEHLYILGDLFEAWVGDDDDADWLWDCLQPIAALTRAGTSVSVMHGNRDFLLGQGFEERTGARLLPGSCVIDLYGRPTLLLHGDSLCTRDSEYQAFRRQVREPAWQRQMLARPLEERRAIALNLRQRSREAAANKADNIMDVTPEEVCKVMRDAGVSTLIHGHTHRPAMHDVNLPSVSGQRWVLGDWGTRGWYLQADDRGEIELVSFSVAA